MAELSSGNAPITPFVFNFADRAEVRTFMENNEPEFVAIDVAAALEYANPHQAIAKNVDEDDLSQREVIDALGRTQKTIVINEAGLYQLIMRSDKPEAKVFQRWVTHEVLPQLRKFGFYGFGKPLTANQTLAAQKLCVTLAEKLVVATDAGLREVLYSQLSHTSRLLNIPVPPMASLGKHIALPKSPWVWVIGHFYIKWQDGACQGVIGTEDEVQGVYCLLIRPSQVIECLMHDPDLAETLALLPVRSPRVLRKELEEAGVVVGECERVIDGKRVGHLLALSLDQLEAHGIHSA
jgi:prophage antirepressor-like protein